MDAVRDEPGVPGRAEGDDVAGAQARGRHDLVEHERAAVVGAGHRAAGDDVALVAQERRHEDGEGEDQRGAGDQDAEATAGEREGRGERHGSPFESAQSEEPTGGPGRRTRPSPPALWAPCDLGLGGRPGEVDAGRQALERVVVLAGSVAVNL